MAEYKFVRGDRYALTCPLTKDGAAFDATAWTVSATLGQGDVIKATTEAEVPGALGVGRPTLTVQGTSTGCTVTICNSKTRDLGAQTRRADVLVVATGKPGMITGAMIKPGAVVIDVGINRGPDGKLCGDVDFASAAQVAGSITPVPGGVGPMTIAMLLVNTVEAAERAAA